MSFAQVASRLSPRGWAVVGGSAAAAILFLYLVFHLASQPSYSTLLTGLDPAQTGKITSTLDTKGINYQLQNGGTALAVSSDQTSQARVALAGAGLLSSQQPGFSLFDKQQLGESNFQQQITYQRALEGQLASTIESIQGVTGAQVQLVLPNPQDQLFADSSTPATAAVLLSGTSTLDPGSVRGIAQLVASSVPGLSLDKVTITDATGALLWPTADSTGGAGSLLSKQAAQARYDSMMAAQVNAMLSQTLGPGKAEVQVNADLNADQSTADTLAYTGKGVPLQQHSQTESLAGNGTSAGGASGTIPAVAQTGASGGKSNYSNKVTDTSFGVNKTITHSVIAPGKINRQSVSVLVDKSVPAASLPAIRAAVTNAVGLVPSRGDTLAFGQVTFAKPTTPSATTTGGVSSYMKYAEYGGAGLGSILFLFFMTRTLRRREHEEFAGSPVWVRELSSPRPLAALGGGGAQGLEQPTQVRELQPPVNVAKRQIENLVQRDPDRVAQQVRAWMAED